MKKKENTEKWKKENKITFPAKEPWSLILYFLPLLRFFRFLYYGESGAYAIGKKSRMQNPVDEQTSEKILKLNSDH